MQMPKCRTCGELTWDRVCGGPGSHNKGARRVTKHIVTNVTKPANTVTKAVTPRANVTKATVTSPPGRVAALEAEIEMLRAEVVVLKRELAGRPGGRPPIGGKAMSDAERARKYRESLKAKAEPVTEFKG